MNEEVPRLNPSELYDKRRSKDAGRLRSYNKILEQIYNRIRTISKLPNSQCYLLYTVPPFILGLPKIDLEDCVVYLIYQLRHAEYEIRFTPPNMIYISWLHHEKTYVVEQSPIMKAMLDSAERTHDMLERKEKEAARILGEGKKTQKKVIKQTPGMLQNRGNTGNTGNTWNTGNTGNTGNTWNTGNTGYKPHSAINTILNRPLTAGPPPPSAADYIPPTTFLQNMTNPQNTAVYPKSVAEYLGR
jgi:hypothetical protein